METTIQITFLDDCRGGGPLKEEPGAEGGGMLPELMAGGLYYALATNRRTTATGKQAAHL